MSTRTTLTAVSKDVATIRALLASGVGAAAFLIPADLIDAFARPAYSPLRHWISHLALGKLGWIGVVIVLVTAALLGTYAAGLFRARRDLGGPVAYPVAVLVSALGLLLAGVFPMDPSMGFPPGAEPTSSVSGSIHDVGGPMFIVGSAVAAFLSRRHLASRGVHARFSRWSWVAATAALLSFAACSALVALDYSGAVPGAWSGLFERLSAYTGLLWGALTAQALLRRAYRR